MEEQPPKIVSIICPVCNHKIIGTQRNDGAILATCSRCNANIFSKKKEKEILIKVKVS